MVQVPFVLCIAVLISVVLDLRTKQTQRQLSFGVVRIVFILPMLVWCYLYTYLQTDQYVQPFFSKSENIFCVLLVAIAYRMYCISPIAGSKKVLRFLFASGCAAVLAVVTYLYYYPLPVSYVDGGLVFPQYGRIYCSALFLLVSVLLLGWRLEEFWRSLETEDKWRYKYMVIGLILVCAMLGWSSSYRLTYLRLPDEHILLIAIVLAFSWVLMVYAITRHRLLNRKIFISRKVVYVTITPIVFAGFLLLVGAVSLLFRLFGWPAPFVLKWLITIAGILLLSALALSTDVRRRVKYFISTHFYVNKYEYRDEWLAFSELLHGKLTEKGVVEALYQIMKDSLYTQTIRIWLGDIHKGFHPVEINGDQTGIGGDIIPGDDAMVCYLHNAPYLYSLDGDSDPLRLSILLEKKDFLRNHDVVLVVPLVLGHQCAGLIGLGSETTGGRYGHDDFDLLLALGSHAASALLAVQNAEQLARAREQSAYTNLSAFVLHDIKNAATMLDLVSSNAAEHIDNPEFQKDMLESIDDAVDRMAKVQARLSTLKSELIPDIQKIDLFVLLGECIDKLLKNQSELDITLDSPTDLRILTDPDFINKICENLIINAREAGGSGTHIRINVKVDAMVRIEFQDDGPGIVDEFLPNALFEPFKTAKKNGSGIGLWQVRQMIELLGGTIQAKNGNTCGACFILHLPNRTPTNP